MLFGISEDMVRKLALPYCSVWGNAQTDAWRRSVAEHRTNTQKALWRRRIGRFFGRAHRGQGHIAAEYDKQWRKKVFERYVAPERVEGGSPWSWRDHAFLMSNEGGARLRQLYLSRAIEEVAPHSVLEVGCGNAINLLVLACRYPKIAFSGLEFTAGGVGSAATGLTADELPVSLREFAPEPIADPTAHQNIQLVRGTAARLPFADNSFDLVLTSLALEQMEEIRSAALLEIARVARRFVLMLEPFYDCNNGKEQRAYIHAYNYFQGTVTDLPNVGLIPQWATADMPSKEFLRTMLVLCHKRSR